VLSLGVRLGVPWLVNPLLGGAAILLAHALVTRVYGRRLADAVVLLMALSPWLIIMSATLMPHPTSLVLCLLVMLAISHAREDGSLLWAIVAGLACGALLHVRPLEAVVTALVAGTWWLSTGWRRLRLAAMAATVVCGTLMGALFLAYNKFVTGDPFLVPLNAFFEAQFGKGTNRLGFGPDIGNWPGWSTDALPGHGPIDVFMNTNQNLHLVQFELFGWAAGSLTLAYLLAVSASWKRDWLMWFWALAVIAVLNLYWFSGGSDYGARYWYFAIVPFAVLVVRGGEWLAERFRSGSQQADATRVWLAVALASLLGTTNLLTWRSLDKYFHYRGGNGGIRALAASRHFGRSLVFIRGRMFPDYGLALTLNPVSLDASGTETIYARELDAASVARVRRYYADRPVWIVAGPTPAVPWFHVVAGPVQPGEPLESAGGDRSADDSSGQRPVATSVVK
jgi:4-amino-4-deoxy-L-arabinose transferase-like glycosyltransferase